MHVLNKQIMTVDELFKSSIYEGLNSSIKLSLKTLISELSSRKMDFYVCKRNEPVIVLKAMEIYDSNPLSTCNIATIRFKTDTIQVEPYQDGDNTRYEFCRDNADEEIFSRIYAIYERKINAFRNRR